MYLVYVLVCNAIQLTSDGGVQLLLLAEFGDADVVVEHGSDLLLVGDELVAIDHLGDGVVEAPHLKQRGRIVAPLYETCRKEIQALSITVTQVRVTIRLQ